MDLDDIVEELIPKSIRKKVKKRLKKRSILELIVAVIAAIFSSERSSDKNGREWEEDRRQPQKSKGSKYESRKTRYESRKPSFNDPIQQSLLQAREYDQKISGLARSAPRNSLEKERLTILSSNVSEWVHAIESIAAKTKTQSEDPLIQQERKNVPTAIKRLEKQLSETKDEKLRQKLERTLANRRKQLEHLQQADTNRQIAELKVENTLAQLGIIYSQIVNESFIAQRGNYERLAVDIQDEILGLEDYLTTLDELQSGA